MENDPKPGFETGLNTADRRGVIKIIGAKAVEILLIAPRKISDLAYELTVGLGNTRD